MSTIGSRQAAGDRLVSFPLHNGAIAADYYLSPSPPLTGGFPSIGSEAIFFLPPGETWGGYRSGYWAGSGATPSLAGPRLEQRFAGELSGAKRLWLIADGQLFTQYPGIGRVIGSGWGEKEHWEFPPFSLTLYEPLGG